MYYTLLNHAHTFSLKGLFSENLWPFSKSKFNLKSDRVNLVARGREPRDAMSLHYADTSLPDFLGRPSLHNAEQASVMH